MWAEQKPKLGLWLIQRGLLLGQKPVLRRKMVLRRLHRQRVPLLGQKLVLQKKMVLRRLRRRHQTAKKLAPGWRWQHHLLQSCSRQPQVSKRSACRHQTPS